MVNILIQNCECVGANPGRVISAKRARVLEAASWHAVHRVRRTLEEWTEFRWDVEKISKISQNGFADDKIFTVHHPALRFLFEFELRIYEKSVLVEFFEFNKKFKRESSIN